MVIERMGGNLEYKSNRPISIEDSLNAERYLDFLRTASPELLEDEGVDSESLQRVVPTGRKELELFPVTSVRKLQETRREHVLHSCIR